MERCAAGSETTSGAVGPLANGRCRDPPVCGAAGVAARTPSVIPAATTATASSRAGVTSAAPIAAEQASALTGSMPENSPPRSTPRIRTAEYQQRKPPVVTASPR